MGHMCALGHIGTSRVGPAHPAKREQSAPSRTWALRPTQARVPHRPPAACKRNGAKTPGETHTPPIPVPTLDLHPYRCSSLPLWLLFMFLCTSSNVLGLCTNSLEAHAERNRHTSGPHQMLWMTRSLSLLAASAASESSALASARGVPSEKKAGST
jgi:hypothetical protein